jgi:hypothetical protein
LFVIVHGLLGIMCIWLELGICRVLLFGLVLLVIRIVFYLRDKFRIFLYGNIRIYLTVFMVNCWLELVCTNNLFIGFINFLIRIDISSRRFHINWLILIIIFLFSGRSWIIDRFILWTICIVFVIAILIWS